MCLLSWSLSLLTVATADVNGRIGVDALGPSNTYCPEVPSLFSKLSKFSKYKLFTDAGIDNPFPSNAFSRDKSLLCWFSAALSSERRLGGATRDRSDTSVKSIGEFPFIVAVRIEFISKLSLESETETISGNSLLDTDILFLISNFCGSPIAAWVKRSGSLLLNSTPLDDLSLSMLLHNNCWFFWMIFKSSVTKLRFVGVSSEFCSLHKLRFLSVTFEVSEPFDSVFEEISEHFLMSGPFIFSDVLNTSTDSSLVFTGWATILLPKTGDWLLTGTFMTPISSVFCNIGANDNFNKFDDISSNKRFWCFSVSSSSFSFDDDNWIFSQSESESENSFAICWLMGIVYLPNTSVDFIFSLSFSSLFWRDAAQFSTISLFERDGELSLLFGLESIPGHFSIPGKVSSETERSTGKSISICFMMLQEVPLGTWLIWSIWRGSLSVFGWFGLGLVKLLSSGSAEYTPLDSDINEFIDDPGSSVSNVPGANWFSVEASIISVKVLSSSISSSSRTGILEIISISL